jgi:hypothetical protein
MSHRIQWSHQNKSEVKIMKKFISIFLSAMLAVSLTACSTPQSSIDDEICPGKKPGAAGKPPVMADGFDPNEKMDFSSVDLKGNKVTNNIFADCKRGTWLVFWQTDNDKTMAELQKLNEMLPIAKENGYKIVGIVIDGEKNLKKAREITADIEFTNIIYNKEVEAIYKDVGMFFTEKFYKDNAKDLAQFTPPPKMGDPVTTRANKRGQLQSSCYLVPVGKKKLEEIWKNNDSNATYEELNEQEKKSIGD